MFKNMRTKLIILLTSLSAGLALADNIIHPTSPVFDRPTLTTLGVQLPITGDDNLNASVTVRYRKTGANTWRQALPLFRVHPENTTSWTVAPQFAGSVFDLRPNTSYDIELHVVDPDGPVDKIFTMTTTTRPVPSDPINPRIVNVRDVKGLLNAIRDSVYAPTRPKRDLLLPGSHACDRVPQFPWKFTVAKSVDDFPVESVTVS